MDDLLPDRHPRRSRYVAFGLIFFGAWAALASVRGPREQSYDRPMLFLWSPSAVVLAAMFCVLCGVIVTARSPLRRAVGSTLTLLASAVVGPVMMALENGWPGFDRVRWGDGLCGSASLLLMGALVCAPVLWALQLGVAQPRTRHQGLEAAMLSLYGLVVSEGFVSSYTRFAQCASESLNPRIVPSARQWTGILVVLLAARALAALVAVRGFFAERRVRARVRAVAAGEVPGWRVAHTDEVTGARDVPALLWLDGKEVLRPRFGYPSVVPHVIVRDLAALAEGIYRGPDRTAVPWARVPARSPQWGASMALNALVAVYALVTLPERALYIARLWC